MTAAGKFDRQITIERKSSTRDAMGGEVITWAPLDPAAGSPTVGVRIWAEVQDLLPSRAESLQLVREVAVNQTRVRIRWRSDITPDMRIRVHGDASDRILQIIGGPAEIGGRKEMIEMMCESFSA